MKCFVASAFGCKDIDAIYDKVIRKALKACSVRATRVDRENHNDDIDDKIFALLGEADFCIADLTYARPSVYYEAGYAAGQGKPVIYLAHASHFEPDAGDTAGNRRIHFDVQMKNVIKWNTPSQRLVDALTRRIKVVTKPLIARKAADTTRRQAVAQYRARPLREQLAVLAGAAKKVIAEAGYERVVDDGGTKSSAFLWSRFLRDVGEYSCSRSKRPHTVVIGGSHALTKSLLGEVWRGLAFKSVMHVAGKGRSSETPRNRLPLNVVVLLVLERSRPNAVLLGLPGYGQERPGIYRRVDEYSENVVAVIDNAALPEDVTERTKHALAFVK